MSGRQIDRNGKETILDNQEIHNHCHVTYCLIIDFKLDVCYDAFELASKDYLSA